MVSGIEYHYHQVLEEINQACVHSGRNPQEVKLLAVTKTQPLEAIKELYRLGHREFGENRVQEAQEKIPEVPSDSVFHLIGHLQSNKAAKAASLFSAVQSIDKLSTAQVLGKAAHINGKKIDILLELNTSMEATKEGVHSFDELQILAEGLIGLEGLTIRGLMTMAPFTQEEGPIRDSFRSLKQAQQQLQLHFPDQDWSTLSMGMSNDFTIAIEEGSTLVRVGTRLFGPRSKT